MFLLVQLGERNTVEETVNTDDDNMGSLAFILSHTFNQLRDIYTLMTMVINMPDDIAGGGGNVSTGTAGKEK